jgi:hypothetical protein
MSAPRIMAEAARHGVTFELLPDGKLKMASKGKPPSHIIDDIKKARDAIVAHLKGEPDPRLVPPKGSLVARLCAAGATVRTWSNGRGGHASVEAPAGISAELVAEVERRGWRIIPGGKPNDEAEHDSWLAGVPAAEFTTTPKRPTR